MSRDAPERRHEGELERWRLRQGGRLASGYAERRLARERHKARAMREADGGPLRALTTPRRAVALALRASGMSGLGRRNACAVSLVRNTLALDTLPSALDGLRVLQLSDPHFGADPAIDRAIVDAASGVEHDLCVLTGDYRYQSFGPIGPALEGLARLREGLGEGVIAVLGNHDVLAMVPPLEAMGITVLLNECATIGREGALLHLVGVDDPRYYRLDDLERALADRDRAARAVTGRDGGRGGPDRDGTAPAATTLLLAHSPEIAEPAAASGCDGYLCGHTHGGQICLPGGIPLMRNARAPRERLRGAWRVGRMSGYTSRGAGVSLAPARFFCPPEITLHVLASHAGA